MEEYRQLVEKVFGKQYKILKCFGLFELSADCSQYSKAIFKVYFWCFFIFWILLFDTVMIMQLITNIRSVDEVAKVLFLLASAIAVFGKFSTVKLNNQSFEDLFKKLYLKKFLPQSPEEKKIFLQSIELNTKVCAYYSNISYLALAGVIMSQYITETEDMPVNIYTPMSLEVKWKYNLVYIYVSLSISVCCFTNVAFDTLTSSLFIHLKGQLDILGYRLENIGKYNRLLELSHEIENLISKPVSLQIGCSVFVLIANFYSLSVHTASGELGNLFKIGAYQACMLSQIFIMFYFANEVSLKSSEISFNLYKSDWPNWNKINRKLALMMMLRFETPIRISSTNRVYSFNLAAFTSIVNLSYSYFALLKRVKS